MKRILLPCFILLISLVYIGFAVGQDAILLKSVERLVLQRGKYTTGRRSSPIPQLKCVGSSCYRFEPVTVTCKNMGSDGTDATWECTSDMPRAYRFGTIDVQCEGYNYPDDPYILKGSCGLEYSIEPTGESDPSSSSYSSSQSYNSYNSPSSSGSTTFGTVFMFGVVCLIFYWIFRSCSDTSRNAHGGHGGGGGGYDAPGNPPPPYGNNNNNDGTSKPSSSSSYSSSSSSSSIPSSFTPNTAQGPGFWSGMLGGAALASMFRGRSQYGYNQGYNHGYGYGGGYNRGYPSSTPSFFSGGGSSGSVERKAYGGTSRR